MKIIQFLWRKSWSRLTLAFIASIVGGVSSVSLIALLQRVISGKWHAGYTLAYLFVALCIVVLFSRMASHLLLTHLSQRATSQLVIQLCRQIVATPLSKLETIGGARLNAALTDDVSILITGLVTIPTVLTQGTVALLCFAYMFWLSPPMSGVVLLLVAAGGATIHYGMGRNRKYLRRAWGDRDQLFKHFRSLVEGIKELKLHRQRRYTFVEEEIPSAAESYERHNLRGTAAFHLGAGIAQSLIYLAMALAVFCLPKWFGAGATAANGFIILLLYLIVPLESLIYALPTVSRANLALKVLLDLQFSPEQHDPRDTSSITHPPQGAELLRLSRIRHTYQHGSQDHEFSLGPIDISIRRGELVFLVGGNGSGKTTLIKILTGLYVPDSGEIRLGTTLITDSNREAYRQSFSVVFHDFHLFEKLIGLEQSDLDTRSQEYLSLLKLDHKVNTVAGRLSSLELSQGQRKRLALLVACLEDRPIYVFDEWASDQDPVFKKFFYTEMLPELICRGKTIVAISHDDHYYKAGSRLIKLVDGVIEFDGAVVNTTSLMSEAIPK